MLALSPGAQRRWQKEPGWRSALKAALMDLLMCRVWGERMAQARLPDLGSELGVNIYWDGRCRVSG